MEHGSSLKNDFGEKNYYYGYDMVMHYLLSCLILILGMLSWENIVSFFIYNPLYKDTYRKNSKIWDTSNNCHNCPKIEKFDVTLHYCIQKMLMEWQTV